MYMSGFAEKYSVFSEYTLLSVRRPGTLIGFRLNALVLTPHIFLRFRNGGDRLHTVLCKKNNTKTL